MHAGQCRGCLGECVLLQEVARLLRSVPLPYRQSGQRGEATGNAGVDQNAGEPEAATDILGLP